jgi:hypothetical protein
MRVYDTSARPRSSASRMSAACSIPRPHTNGACTTRVSPTAPCSSTPRRAHSESIRTRHHGRARARRQFHDARARRRAAADVVRAQPFCVLAPHASARVHGRRLGERVDDVRAPRGLGRWARSTLSPRRFARGARWTCRHAPLVRAKPPLPEAAATASSSDQPVHIFCGSSSPVCSSRRHSTGTKAGRYTRSSLFFRRLRAQVCSGARPQASRSCTAYSGCLDRRTLGRRARPTL